jgi:hypothetical protein
MSGRTWHRIDLQARQRFTPVAPLPEEHFPGPFEQSLQEDMLFPQGELFP